MNASCLLTSWISLTKVNESFVQCVEGMIGVDNSYKFKQLTSDPTKLREGQLQLYLRKLNNKGYFDESAHDYIRPVGSSPQDCVYNRNS